MEIKNKKNHLSRIGASFIILLFAMCLTMNMFFCSSYDLYEFSEKITAKETWAISENIAANGDGDNIACFNGVLFNENNSNNETIWKNISTISMIAAIPKGISLHLFLIIVYLFFFLTLFILLPDGWTLVQQKVRLDN